VSCNKGEQREDLYEKSARVCHKHQVSNRLDRKVSKHKNPLIFKHRRPENTIMQRQILYHNINCNNSCESFDHELSGMRRKHRRSKETICHKTRNLTYRCTTRKPEWLLKLYSWELCSTIDRYKMVKTPTYTQNNNNNKIETLH
jgi:transposase-like protein